MTDTVRCPSCRGAKKVPKLGGMIGECNTCLGKGNILACDKPVAVITETAPITEDIIKAAAECLPIAESVAKISELPIHDPKNIYRKKKA